MTKQQAINEIKESMCENCYRAGDETQSYCEACAYMAAMVALKSEEFESSLADVTVIEISLERYSELIVKENLLDMLTAEKDIKVSLEYRLRAMEGANV